MTTIQKINKKIQELPETVQEKVLEYVEELHKEKEEDKKWLDFSLSNAMIGLENEDVQYDENDLKEKWN